MRQTVKMSNQEDLPLSEVPDPQQLDRIKIQIDLVLLALEALAGISSDSLLRAARDLHLTSVGEDRLAMWRLRQSTPWRHADGQKTLNLEEARSLVLIICHLAKYHQELIRRAVSLLEQMTAQNQDVQQTALLGDYLDTFANIDQKRMLLEDSPPEEVEPLALKLLVDLLFYSSANGHQRLWQVLLAPSASLDSE